MKTENKPHIIKAGRGIKAKIWTNDGPKGSFETVQFARVYKSEDDKLKDSDRFSRNDLLHVAWAAIRAFEQTEPEAKKKADEA